MSGFWLQWLSTEKAKESRRMIDRLLGLVQDGKLKYKYVLYLSKHKKTIGEERVGAGLYSLRIVKLLMKFNILLCPCICASHSVDGPIGHP